MATSFAFAEVKALVLRRQREQAQQLLERLAAAVLPILTRRRFRVRRLLEFFPTDGALLGMNVNRGAKIYVRLRPKRTPESFYPYEALLETLLHELTHMVHGPHNQAFYQYLDELKQEMESLMVRGLEGQEAVKFADAGAGQRLGGDSARVPICVAAVLAAKRREQVSRGSCLE
uniref:WLM domain-containing protein n=1 Tax=Phytophthora ramorum TaxID=164328 RepID=H3GW61_PHYRM